MVSGITTVVVYAKTDATPQWTKTITGMLDRAEGKEETKSNPTQRKQEILT